ncbi:MAG: hypothetical protein WBA16_11375 [Nonlabens sp.]
MKKRIFAVACLSVGLAFNSCSDDDDVVDGRFDRAELFATSNTNGNVTIYDFSSGSSVETTTLTTPSSNNEGVRYNATLNELYVSSISDDQLYVINDVDTQITGLAGAAQSVVTGPTDLDTPRAIAFRGNAIIVADSEDDALYVYIKAGDAITLRNRVDVDFEVWGIDFVNDDLYAVKDGGNGLAIFENFFVNFAATGFEDPTKSISIEGIVRTHGIFYSQEDDILFMTDIGDAGSDDDGGFHIIDNPVTKFGGLADGSVLTVANNQVRTSGAATLMGNPVDITYDAESNTVFVAEKANGGGRILGFNNISGGNVAPSLNNTLSGASSVDFYGED